MARRWLVEERGYPPEMVTRNRVSGHMLEHVKREPREQPESAPTVSRVAGGKARLAREGRGR